MKRLLAAATLALAAGSIAAGCGDSDSSTTTTTALTKSEFLALGNKICAKGDKKINQEANKVFKGKEPNREELDKFATDTVIPTVQFEIAGIKALPAPSGDEEQVDAITSAAEQDLAKVKANPSILTAGQGSDDPFAEANKLAKQYGLTACAG